MRLPLILILPLLIIDALVDWYICRQVWHRCSRGATLWRRVALWSSAALALFLIALILWPKKSGSDSDLSALMWCLYAYFTIYLPKYMWVVFDLISKAPQLFKHKRIKAVSIAGGVVALLTFVMMWWGALINRYQIEVQEVTITNPSVPEGFDGFRIVQFSDLHTGSFGSDTTFVSKLVDRINSLEPDAVLFTGDIVNRHTSELEPFTSVLSRITAPVFSVLGNHDYGDYYRWPDSIAKAADHRRLIDLQHQMGWDLLNNSSRVWRCRGDSMVIIGVENIGDPPFAVYGDLDRAYPGNLADSSFKILMSHNPSHWLDDIKDAPDKNIALTLSGHTHAMQMELFGISPAAWRYPTWGGLYADADSAHRLYVNIGAGEVGIPARIGATPELTIINLRRGTRP